MSDEVPIRGAIAPKFKLNGLYIKDISFENPSAPEIFFKPDGKPNIDIKIDLGLSKVGNGNYEVVLKIITNATTDSGKTMFLAELLHAGLFAINPELAPETHEKILLTECATIIFPFARRLIADLVQESGFPPLLLEPVNFEAIYNSRQKAVV